MHDRVLYFAGCEHTGTASEQITRPIKETVGDLMPPLMAGQPMRWR